MPGLTRFSLPFVAEEMFGLTKDLEPESHRFVQRYSFPLISSPAVPPNKTSPNYSIYHSLAQQETRAQVRDEPKGEVGNGEGIKHSTICAPSDQLLSDICFFFLLRLSASSNTVGEYNCLHSFPGGCKSHSHQRFLSHVSPGANEQVFQLLWKIMQDILSKMLRFAKR